MYLFVISIKPKEKVKMAINPDNREIVTNGDEFPYPTVIALDGIEIDKDRRENDFIGSGITIAPMHVLTAAHNAFNVETGKPNDRIRTTTSKKEDSLQARLLSQAYLGLGDPKANVEHRYFLADYNKTRATKDDIALLKTSNELIAAKDVIGLIAFVDPATAYGLTIDTAGYPGDNYDKKIPGQTGIGVEGRDLVRTPKKANSPGTIAEVNANWEFWYSQNMYTATGQSGSGIWHTVDKNNDYDKYPRVLGVHTNAIYDLINNQQTKSGGVLISTGIYDKIMKQIEIDWEHPILEDLSFLRE
jgi:hypothetical protein